MKRQAAGQRLLWAALVWGTSSWAQPGQPLPAAEPEAPPTGDAAPADAAPTDAAPADAAAVDGREAPSAEPPTGPVPEPAAAANPASEAATTATAPTLTTEPLPNSSASEPVATLAPQPAELVSPASLDEGLEYPKFTPSLRLMTGFEWTREQRLAATGRLDNESYGFFLSQARAQLEGKLTKRIELEISAELADAYDSGVVSTSDRPLYIRDAFLNLRAKRYFQLRAGHFKRPISALEHRSAGQLQVRGRGLTNDLIIEDNAWGSRGLGVQAWGKVKTVPLVWALGVFNPLWTASAASRPRGLDLLARLAVEPVRGLTLGVNGGLKHLDTPPYDEYQSFFAGGADIQFERAGFFLLLDGLLAQLPLVASDLSQQTAAGLVLLTSYDISLTPEFSLQPTLMAEYADASLDHSNSESLRAVVGINAIFHESLRIMPQVEVVDWLTTPTQLSPTQSLSAYLMFSLAM